MGKCFYCGHEVIWNSDFNADECGYDDEDYKDRIVTFYTCPFCGTEYEVVQPDSIPSEPENAPTEN